MTSLPRRIPGDALYREIQAAFQSGVITTLARVHVRPVTPR